MNIEIVKVLLFNCITLKRIGQQIYIYMHLYLIQIIKKHVERNLFHYWSRDVHAKVLIVMNSLPVSLVDV